MGKTVGLLLLAQLFAGCATTIGRWDQAKYAATDFGAARTVNVCTYRDAGVSAERAQEVLRGTVDEWQKYGVALNVTDRGEMQRRGFWHNELLDQIDSVPLTPPCDRVFWLVNRSASDYLYANGPMLLTFGMPAPEVLGEVDDPTMTHGWAIAYGDSLNTLLMEPDAVVKHEFYHLVGSCPHAHTMDACYRQIAALKHREGQSGWYPSMGMDGRAFSDRQEANRTLAIFRDPFLP